MPSPPLGFVDVVNQSVFKNATKGGEKIPNQEKKNFTTKTHMFPFRQYIIWGISLACLLIKLETPRVKLKTSFFFSPLLTVHPLSTVSSLSLFS